MPASKFGRFSKVLRCVIIKKCLYGLLKSIENLGHAKLMRSRSELTMGNQLSTKHSSFSNKSIPSWVCAALKLPRKKVSRLILNDASRECYRIMLQYLAHHAVDIGEPAPVMKGKLQDEPKRKLMHQREYSGRLSSLIVDMHPGNEPHLNDEALESDSENKELIPHASYLFGIGRARLVLNGVDVFVQHTEENMGVASKFTQGTKLRTIELFAADENVLRDLGDVAIKWDFLRNRPERSTEGVFYKLFTLAVNYEEVYWKSHGWKQSRSQESVVLADGMLNSILKDFAGFSSTNTKSWYVSHGLPHRRSYLFHGPPGVGKTSTIRFLCGKLELPAYFLTLGDEKIGNRELQDALRIILRPAILVIEDVDALFNEDRDSKNNSPLTFSALLNSLDGFLSADGILTVMTTNHIEKIDPALIRAGRVDRKFEFKSPTQEQIEGLFLGFYPNENKSLASEFSDAVFARHEKQARSIATLQQHFIFTRGLNARDCVDAIDDFFKEFYPGGGYDQTSHLYS